MPDPRPAVKLPPHPSLRPVRQHPARRQHRPSAPLARRAGGTARGPGYQRRRGQSAQAALAAMSVLRQSHDHHRDIPARRLARQDHARRRTALNIRLVDQSPN
jgi:hypothetical protein